MALSIAHACTYVWVHASTPALFSTDTPPHASIRSNGWDSSEGRASSAAPAAAPLSVQESSSASSWNFGEGHAPPDDSTGVSQPPHAHSTPASSAFGGWGFDEGRAPAAYAGAGVPLVRSVEDGESAWSWGSLFSGAPMPKKKAFVAPISDGPSSYGPSSYGP